MSLEFDHPHTTTVKIIAFLQETFRNQGKTKAVIAVSGGIDSGLALTLLAKALPPENIFPILLPFGEQSMENAREVCEFVGIPKENVQTIDIEPAVKQIMWTNQSYSTPRVENLSEPVVRQILDARVTLGFPPKAGRQDDEKVEDNISIGNIKARVRMIFVYDMAKRLEALVCGTENKSEKHLAYFTRFGDEASDIEPIQHLYKTQVRQLAAHLQLPEQVLTAEPSAGLWDGQTDEDELGFSYHDADLVMEQYVDGGKTMGDIEIEGVANTVVKKVVERIESQKFKHQVPYTL